MNKLNFHPLEPLRFPLVNRLYKDYYPAGKAKKDEVIWVGDSDKGLITAVRFRQFGDYQLLTGMLVHPAHRRQNIASQLLKACQIQITAKSCYCLAFSHLVSLYQAYGFKLITSCELPNELKGRFTSYSNSGKDLVPMIYAGSEC